MTGFSNLIQTAVIFFSILSAGTVMVRRRSRPWSSLQKLALHYLVNSAPSAVTIVGGRLTATKKIRKLRRLQNDAPL